MSNHTFPEAGPSSLVMKRATPAGTWAEARKYAVIVDAGSSGSRLQVYSWRDPAVERTQRTKAGKSAKILPTVEKGTFSSDKDWQLKIEPGLSSFGAHPDDLGAYLAPLFQHAKSIIPPDALASTPVYVLATAGMRLLPDEQRAAVLKETCQYIQHSTPFRLSGKGCEDHVQVITGEEEGLLGWIAINYLMDGFKFRPAGTDATSGQSTYGFLDMGGASTQIAFEPSKAAQAVGKDKEDLSPVTLRMLDGTDVVHDVFVTTFLGYGTNKARDRYVQALAAKDTSSFSDPCLPAGLELSTSDKKKLVGTGSFDNCLKQLSPLLEKDAACTRPPCLFHGVHVPAIDFSVNHFIGVSEYWFSSNDVYSLGGAYDFVAFQKAAQQFCGRNWKELEADLKKGDVFGKQVNEDRLELQCFKSAWMATVLHEGIGLPRIIDQGGKGDGRKHANDASDKASEKNLFQSVNDVNGLSVSWTLGKAVLEASRNIAPLSAAADTPIGLPANASDVKEVAMVPIQADSGIVQYKEQYDWSNHSEALLNEAKESVAEHRYVAGAVLLLLLASLLLCCVRRRRRGSTNRKETRLSKLWPSFLSRQQATSGRGDYTLANMEEGHDLAQLDGKTGRALGSANTASVDSALPSTSESSGDEREADDKRRRAKRPGNIITSLVVPIQRAALALGIKSAESPVATTGRRGHTRRLTSSNRVPMRYNASATPVSTSQPVSPRGQSRPSSRTSLMRSPRSAGHDKSFLLRQASSTQQMASPSLATTSAMNSRASSPAFGHASVVTARPNTPGVLATNLGSPFYAPAASQRHNSATSAFASIATGGASTPVSRSAASTPTSAMSYFPPQLQTGGHFAQQQHMGASSRFVPQRAASSMSHFARGAWEDD